MPTTERPMIKELWMVEMVGNCVEYVFSSLLLSFPILSSMLSCLHTTCNWVSSVFFGCVFKFGHRWHDVISSAFVVGDCWITLLSNHVFKSWKVSTWVTSSDMWELYAAGLSLKTTVNTGTSCERCWILICCVSWTLPLVPQHCRAASWETAS